MDEIDLNDPMGSMLAAFRMSQIASSFVFGVIGIFVFRYGKKNANWKIVYTSIALMLYPMFTPNWMFDWGVGIALCWLAHWFDKNEDLTG